MNTEAARKVDRARLERRRAKARHEKESRARAQQILRARQKAIKKWRRAAEGPRVVSYEAVKRMVAAGLDSLKRNPRSRKGAVT